MSGLPEGWAKCVLKDCALVNMGQSPKGIYVNEIGEGVPFYQGKTEFTKLYPVPRKYCVKPTKMALPEDILLSVRAPVGPTNLCPEESCIGRGLAAIRGGECLHQSYLMNYFRHLEPWLSQQGTGSTFKAINGAFLKEIDVLIAPLNEQISIANKLDSLLAKVDKAQARLGKIPVQLKRFRQSVLAAATSGEFTEGSSESWPSLKLNDIASHVVDCPHSTPKWEGQGKFCARTTAFKPFKLDVLGLNYVSEDTYEERISRLKPMPGDILYSREGAILGIACQIPEGIELCLGQRMVVIRCSELVDPKYLTMVLNSEVVTKVVKSLTIGNAAPRVNMKAIREFMIPLPKMEEQKEIVQRVEFLFALADTIDKQYKAAKARLDRLTQSILAKAFRGELVPQDPNDESAAELLKRIQAERDRSVKVKSSNKKQKAHR